MRREAIVIVSIFLILTLVNSAYAMEANSNFFLLDIVTFLNGGGPVSSTNNNADFTGIGENFVSIEASVSSLFRLLAGQLYLILPSLPWERMKVISDLRARTEILGPLIFEATWQKDNDPYFYWQIDIKPAQLLKGFSVSLDTPPDSLIDTTSDYYQFSADSILSGKHTFFVLPFTSGNKPEEDSLLEFALWVDAEPPLINQIQPVAGLITTDNLIPLSCSLSDAHSGIDKVATIWTLDNQTLPFDYEVQKQTLSYKPDAPLAEGAHTVLLKAVDAVGNSIVKAWDFIVDTQPPTAGILLNGGLAVTHSAYVSINIAAQDSTSGIKNIYLSNDGVFDTELSQPYPYTPLISNWLLAEPDTNGTKTVYAKFEDFAGNISATCKDTIELELRTPDTRIISGPASATEETEAAFVYEASKAGCLFSYKLDYLTWSDWQSSNRADFSGLTTGNHYFYVKAGLDLNADGKIAIDEEDPTPAQWAWTIKPAGYLEKLRERILFWRR